MSIAFACNDHRNGMGQGWFDAFRLTLPDCDGEFEGPRTVIRDIGKGRVRIGRHAYSHSGWMEWVGNWCWDEILVDDVPRFLERMYAKGFRCTCAPSDLYNVFNDGGDVSDIITARENEV